MENLNDCKTTVATVRHALKRKGVYLPDHRTHRTSLHYMKEIINGRKKFVLASKVLYVDVPKYEELQPENVIS